MESLPAGLKDMDEEMAASHMGQTWAKAPFGLFRVIGPVFTVLLLFAELMALYAWSTESPGRSLSNRAP